MLKKDKASYMGQDLITCLVNKKNGFKFILLEEYASGICTVINPNGEILHLGLALFEEEPLLLEETKALEDLSSVQLDKYKEYLDQLEQREQRARQVEQKSKVDIAILDYKKSQAQKRPSTRVSTRKAPLLKGVGASWNSTKLTFYKHKIEPLQPTQSFSINIEGVGKFICSKKDFLSNFNEVVISTQYKNDGLYTFQTIPEKAYKFIQTSEPR